MDVAVFGKGFSKTHFAYTSHVPISSSRAITRRWFDLLLYAGVSSAVISPLIQPVQRLTLIALDHDASQPHFLRFILVGLALVAISIYAVYARFFAMQHLRYFFSNPPGWTAAILGYIGLWWWSRPLFLAAVSRDASESVQVGVVAVSSLSAASIAVPIYKWLAASTKRTNDQLQQQSRGTLGSKPTVVVGHDYLWWQDDDPIDDPEHDRFNSSAAATRIADQIRRGRSVALTGPFGSGKTTIQKLAERKLNGKDFWVVCIEGWGLSDKDAPGRLLRQILDAVSRRTDATRFRSLPKEYRAAIRGAHTTTGSFLDAVAAPPSPFQVLAELDQTLEAIGVTVVVRLEDLDRNSGTEENAMRQAAALLDRLHRLSRITFVIAIDTRRAGAIDLLRLCDHTEPLPPFQPGTILSELSDFTKQRLAVADSQVDLGNSTRRSLWFGRSPSNFRIRTRQTETTSYVDPHASAMAMARLLNTPRKLKTVLRQADQSWSTLRGEIEPVDLLVETALRISSDQAWSFIVGEIDNIRRIKASPWSTVDDAKAQEAAELKRNILHDRLSSILSDTAYERSEIDVLIHHLFGDWLSKKDAAACEGYWLHNQSPQSSTNYGPTDYLRRLIRRSIDETPSDQKFSEEMNEWLKLGKGGTLVSMLHDIPHASDQLEQLFYDLPSGSYLELASLLFAKSRSKFGNNASTTSTPAHMAVWRLVNRKRRRGVPRFLRAQLRVSLKCSLVLTMGIKNYWASEETVDNHTDVKRRAQQFLGILCRRSFTDARKWLNALPNPAEYPPDEQMDFEDEHVLWQLMRWHPDVWDPAWWGWATPMLISAAEAEPDRLAPLLRCLLVKPHAADPANRIYSIDEEFLGHWCPSPVDQRRLLHVLVHNGYTGYSIDLHQSIQAEAQTKLGEYPEPVAAPERRATESPSEDVSIE